MRNLSYFQTRLALIIDYMIIFNSYTRVENFCLVYLNRGEISARLTVMNFLQIVILFLHCCRLTCKMKSHHCLTNWNFSLGWKYPFTQPFIWSFLRKVVNHFHKRLHLRYLTGFWMHLSCVRDNYLSVIFLHNLICYFFCFLWWFKVLSFSIFPIFHEIHAPAL